MLRRDLQQSGEDFPALLEELQRDSLKLSALNPLHIAPSGPQTVKFPFFVTRLVTEAEHTPFCDKFLVMDGAPMSDRNGAWGHALRNKLAIIMGTCELLLEHETDPETSALLLQIRQAAKEMGDAFQNPRSNDEDLGRSA